MSTQTISTPDLGVEQAQVIEIVVTVGDTVQADDTILLAESDKASVEIPAGISGVVSAVLVNMGDTIKQGTELLKVDSSSSQDNIQDNQTSNDTKDVISENETKEANTDTKTSAQSISQARSQNQTLTIPDLGVDKAEVIEILANVGDNVSAQDNIILLESDKASMEVPTSIAGEITAIHVAVGDSVSAGVEFVSIKSTDSTDIATTNEPSQSVSDSEQTSSLSNKQSNSNKLENVAVTQNNTPTTVRNSNNVNKSVYAGPAVRKLCRELGVDIAQVTGSAVNGRIVKDDVHAFVKNKLSSSIQHSKNINTTAMNGLPPLPDMSGAEWGATHEQPLTNLQKVSIPQLCYNTLIPQVTQFDLADITDTENYRQSVKDKLKKDGVSLTIVAFVIKAVAYALRQYPKFNSHLSDDHSALIMRDEVHLGMAVATDHGLIVPVIRHADQKGLVQIATELKELATKARDKKLGMSALTGAGFSISSQGNMGGTYFTPLVNVPQVAILGVSEATIQPRWNAKSATFEPRLILPLSLSYDHRVINGADAAVFTRYLANLLSDMRQVLM